jgi:hypothetical protein
MVLTSLLARFSYPLLSPRLTQGTKASNKKA